MRLSTYLRGPFLLVMDDLPRHCLENATFFQLHDDMDLRMTSRGVKTTFKFIRIPDFYTIDEEQYFVAEMKIEGLKIGTAALANDRVLNIKLQELESPRNVRNLNFLIPSEANAREVSVEVFHGNRILVRASMRKKQHP